MDQAIETGDHRKSRLITYLNLGWLIVGMVSLITIPLNLAEWQIQLVLAVIAISSFFLFRVLNQRGKIRLAGILFSLLINFTFLGLFYLEVLRLGPFEAFQTQSTVWMLAGISIIFAGALVRPRVAFLIAFFNSVLLILSQHYMALNSEKRPSVVIFFWLLALTIWFYESTLEKILAGLIRGREELEEQVAARTASMSQTVAELEKARQEQAAIHSELESLSYTVSHDLRAPLRVIESYGRFLEEDLPKDLSGDITLYLDGIRQNAHHMEAMINSLLQFSRLSRLPIDLFQVDMNAVVKEVWQGLIAQAPERAVEFSMADLPSVACDLQLIRQVWTNLLSNALKYTQGRMLAKIAVGSERLKGEVVYHVRDNGIGFDMQHADKIFEVFQRLHPVERFEGLGIGLASVQRIIKRHSGRVWAEAAEEQGATFFFALEDTSNKRPGSFS